MKNNSLAVFVGQSFFEDASGFSTGESFIKFVEAFSEIYGRITLLARVEPEQRRAAYSVNPECFRVVSLPYFDQLRPLSLFKSLPRLREVIAAEVPKHSAIWVGGPHLVGWQVVRCCQRRGVPFFVMIRQNLIEQIRHKTKGFHRLIALSVARVLEMQFRRLAERELVFTVGREMYQAYGGDDSKNVHEIYINLIRQCDIPSSLPVRRAEQPFRLLWVGRLSAEKGLHVLLEAMAGFSDSPFNAILTLVGTGSERQELEQLASRLGLGNWVQFAGYVPFGPELVRHYEEADLFVLPSLTGEGLPQVLLEAMAAGLPCLASAVEGIPYFITDREDGRLVPAGDAVALQAAIRELADNESLRRRLAAAGLEKVRAHSMESERNKVVRVLGQRLHLHTSSSAESR